MNKEQTNLFQPFTFKKGITVRNKVAMAPMTTWASNDDYTISDEESKTLPGKSKQYRTGNYWLHKGNT